MLTKLKKLKDDRSSQGFTIIEVMIVLAIAGLILLIVFLAVPALQRNARNTTLKSDASAVAGGITEFVSNNNGSQPTAITQAGTALTIKGPAGSANVDAQVNGSTTVTVVAATPANGTIGTGNVKVQLGHDCAGAVNSRASGVWFGVEVSGGNVAKCVQS